jgi:RHS repeat-associated protein
MGQVTQETLGNGIVTTRAYDAVTHWLGSVQSGVGGGATVKNLGFLYDELGNLTQRQDNNLGLTESIFYDAVYRFDHSLLNGTQNLKLTYDVMGNITSRTDISAGATWTYDPVHKHQVTQLGSSNYQYTYDLNGNGTARPHTVDTWTSYNYPTGLVNSASMESWAFSYGPDRQRWQQVYNGTINETTDYIGGLMELVLTGSSDYRHYIYAGATPVAVYSRKSSGANTFSYFIADHQGSIASITNSSGAQVVGENFAAFGERRDASTWASSLPNSTDLATMAGITRQGYTFQTVLGDRSALNHMNGRIEDAFAGRFLSADPHVPNPTNTQSYNRYSYVNNNPLTFTDPTGFEDEPGAKKPVNDPCDTQGGCETVTIDGHQDPPPPKDYVFDPNLNAGPIDPPGGSGSDGSPMQEVVVTGHPPPKPNLIICKVLGTAAGAVSGAVGGLTFAVATGNVTPAALGGAALGGAVVGGAVAFAAPNGGFNGAITAAVASLAAATRGGTSAEGFSEVAGDVAGGYASPAFALPVGVGAGAVRGALTIAGVMGEAGTAGGALIGGNAGGLAAAAALSTNSALNATISYFVGCP